jgi:hypothetical protein
MKPVTDSWLVTCEVRIESARVWSSVEAPGAQGARSAAYPCGTQATSNAAIPDASALDTFDSGVTGH